MSDPIDAAATSLHQNGAVLLKRVLSPPALAELQRYVRQAFAEAEAGQKDGTLNAHQASVLALNMLDPGLLPRETTLIDLAEMAVRGHVPGLVVERYFGGPIVVHRDSVRGRHQPPAPHRSYTPFHQDCSFLGVEPVWINCWIPLSDCGRNAPGLDLYTGRTREVFAQQEWDKGDTFPIGSIPETSLRRAGGAERNWVPELTPGDVILFDSFVPHRTASHPGMTESRMSIEIRFGPV